MTTARGCARYGVRANAICPRARTAMTAELMGAAPAGGADPLAPRARRAAGGLPGRARPRSAINGEVFVVHGGVAAVLEPPRIRATVLAGRPRLGRRHVEPGDGRSARLDPVFSEDGSGPAAGFACEDTLALATETIGFEQRSEAA